MDRFKSYITGLIGTIITVIGLTYIFYGLTDIVTKGKTIEEIIVSSALATLVGWFVAILYSELAFIHGFSSKMYEEAKEAKGVVLSEVINDIDKVHTFCYKRNVKEYDIRKASLLSKVGLTLKKYEDGDIYKEEKEYIYPLKLNKVKNNVIKRNNRRIRRYNRKVDRIDRKIKKAYFEEYTFDELINGIDKPSLKKKRRASVDRYRTFKYSKKIISSTLTGILFGYYGLMFSKDPNWGMVIYLAIQFASFNANGIIQYMMSRAYITNNMRSALVEDTNKLYEFKSSLKNNKEWYIEEEKPKIVIREDKQPIIQHIKDNLSTERLDKAFKHTLKKEGESFNELQFSK